MTTDQATIDYEDRPRVDARLGRYKYHDPRSRGYVAPRPAVDRSTWRDKAIRITDPLPNPNQPVGNCTCCAKAMQLNATGNRVARRVLDMDWALDAYVWETHHDDFPGAWNRDGTGQDTGSNGLASCKTAQALGVGAEYLWEFAAADGVVQQIMAGRVMSAGTWWYGDMMPGPGHALHAGLPILTPTGGHVGGHQYVLRGYDHGRDLVLGRCWWGTGLRDFWVARTHLDSLLRDGGDAHWQRTVAA